MKRRRFHQITFLLTGVYNIGWGIFVALNPSAKRLLIRDAGEIIPLTPKIFDTLLYFVENGGKVIEKDELMREIWTDTIVEENNLNKNISILRRVPGEKPGEHRFIVTIPGHGYKFVADVIQIDAEPPSRGDAENAPAERQNVDDEKIDDAKKEDVSAGNAAAQKYLIFAALILLIGGGTAFYFWQSTAKPVSSPIKTIAVLPFKSLGAETETGISYFQQAIAADPNYALACAGLADAYRGRVVGGEMSSAEIFQKARTAANKAIEIDDALAEGHANLGHIMFWYDWDWNAAENQHKRALELDPNSADTLQFYAHLLSNMGRHAEALVKIKRARELDPLNLRINAPEGLFLLHAGQTDEAIARLEKTLELDSNFRLANMFAARAYSEKEMFAEAAAATRKAGEPSVISSEPIAYGTYALAKAGKINEAQAALDELLKLSTARYVPYHFALVYNALGESGKALDYLEKAFAEKDVRMVFLKVEPKWNNLRGAPRFVDLMRRMNFE